MTTTTPELDVVVVTTDLKDVVLRCLDHLAEPVIGHVVVVDNASSDGTAEAVGKRFPSVELARLDRRESLAAAYNRGAARGSLPYVLFLNDDIFALEGSVASLVAEVEQRPEAVAATGRLIDPGNGPIQVEYQPRRFPTLMSFVAALVGLDDRWKTNPWTGRHRRDPLDQRQVVSVEHAAGACLLVRRETFEAIGGWDEQYTFWFEDVDISRRLRSVGDVLYVPHAPFEHVGGATTRRFSRAEAVTRHYNSALRYGSKHFAPLPRMALGALYLLVGVIRERTSRDDAELAEAYRAVRRNAAGVLRGRFVAQPRR